MKLKKTDNLCSAIGFRYKMDLYNYAGNERNGCFKQNSNEKTVDILFIIDRL